MNPVTPICIPMVPPFEYTDNVPFLITTEKLMDPLSCIGEILFAILAVTAPSAARTIGKYPNNNASDSSGRVSGVAGIEKFRTGSDVCTSPDDTTYVKPGFIVLSADIKDHPRLSIVIYSIDGTFLTGTHSQIAKICKYERYVLSADPLSPTLGELVRKHRRRELVVNSMTSHPVPRKYGVSVLFTPTVKPITSPFTNFGWKFR